MNYSTDSESSAQAAKLTTPEPTNSTWKPDPHLHTSLVASVQQFIDRISARHLEPLQQNKLFENSEDGYIRVQNFAFSQGFAVVKGGGNPKERIQLRCIHHRVLKSPQPKVATENR